MAMGYVQATGGVVYLIQQFFEQVFGQARVQNGQLEHALATVLRFSDDSRSGGK